MVCLKLVDQRSSLLSSTTTNRSSSSQCCHDSEVSDTGDVSREMDDEMGWDGMRWKGKEWKDVIAGTSLFSCPSPFVVKGTLRLTITAFTISSYINFV
ncbi:unnamed protein product [Brugia pahangi]|uniref:Uncharacterized protein n=1 Tax=Brugia pahangi TaxID=6280 RepID=A0A0N4TYV1_BRUPA|nr:unnamed protein product [Brugia pahangi]